MAKSTVMAEVASYVTVQGPKCGLNAFLSTQSKEDAAEFTRLINDRRVQAPAIWRALEKRGYTLGLSTVKAHRQRECRTCWNRKD